jgi:hypothetical protein
VCYSPQSQITKKIAKDHTTQHEKMMMVSERVLIAARPTAWYENKNIFQQVLNSLTSIWSSPHKFSLFSPRLYINKLVEYSNFFIESLFNIINFFSPLFSPYIFCAEWKELRKVWELIAIINGKFSVKKLNLKNCFKNPLNFFCS